jgi:hypothetical protein
LRANNQRDRREQVVIAQPVERVDVWMNGVEVRLRPNGIAGWSARHARGLKIHRGRGAT